MTEATATVAALPYSRTNPFPARMLVNRRLSGPESEKDTRHFELDLTGWGLSFEVGDSVGVYPTNDPDLVDEIIHALGATGDEQVPRLKGEPTSLREALLRDYSVTQPTPKFLKAIAHRADAAPTLHYLLAPDRKQDLQTYLWGMEVIDFLDRTSVRALYARKNSSGCFQNYSRDSIQSLRASRRFPIRCISLWTSFVTRVMAASAAAWPLHFSPSAPTMCPFRFSPATQNIFISRKARIRRSLWWGPAQVLRRFERICRNDR